MKVLNLILAILAFLVSGIALYSSSNNSGCSDVNTVSLSLITICTTLIVAFALIDTLRVYQVEKKVAKLESTATHLESMHEKVNISIIVAYGLALLNYQPYTAFNYFLKALRQSFILNDAKWIGQSLKCMRNTTMIVKIKKKKGEAIEESKDKLSLDIFNDIRELDLYKAFKREIDETYKEIFELIKQ